MGEDEVQGMTGAVLASFHRGREQRLSPDMNGFLPLNRSLHPSLSKLNDRPSVAHHWLESLLMDHYRPS